MSNLINLTSLLGGLSELGTVKKHLLRASREVLLAVQGLLEFVEQYVSGSSSTTDRQQTLQAAISYAQKTLRSITRQIPRGDEDEFQALHRKVVGSILEVLEGEIRKNNRQKTQKAKMKAEVFQAIRNVLLKEMYEPEVEANASNG